ncbi:putative cytochrome 82C4-like [Capsicum annuum]|nr:putative cytochrome 82C4-like [Capsicum annuum]
MAAAATTAAVEQQCVPAQVVGNAFVQQYYHILHHSPGLVFRFYQDRSKVGRPEDDGSMSITTTMQAINDKILSLNYGDFKAEIRSVDSQESFNGGVHVLVTGYLTGNDNLIRNFSQTFFLAPQERGYFVLNDMFRYIENVNQNDVSQVLEDDVVAPVTPEQEPPPVQQNHISEQSTPSVEEANEREVYDPPENGDVPVEEEVPVTEIVDEMQDDSQTVVESNFKSEDAPKKSYASIVMHLKESAASFPPPPAPASRKPMERSVGQVNQPPITATDRPASSSNSVDNANSQEGEGMQLCYSAPVFFLSIIWLLLPELIFTLAYLSSGTTGQGNMGRLKAAERRVYPYASPILIGGREAVVEEKRSTNSRGKSNIILLK